MNLKAQEDEQKYNLHRSNKLVENSKRNLGKILQKGILVILGKTADSDCCC